MLVISSCLDPYIPPAVKINYAFLTVQGFLTGGEDTTIITLSRSLSVADTGKVPDLNSVVQIQEQDGPTHTLNNAGNGKHKLANLNLTVDQRYRILINTGDQKQYASDYVPYLPTPAVDSLSWHDQYDDVRIAVNTHDPANRTHYYLWDYQETWIYTSIYLRYLLGRTVTTASGYYYKDGKVYERDHWDYGYCWKSHDSKDIFINSSAALGQDRIADNFIRLIPHLSRMLRLRYSMQVNQHALTREAYEYWALIRKTNETLGNLFSPQPVQVFGNIHNIKDPSEIVFGYFSASEVTHKRILIDGQQISGPHVHQDYDPDGYEDCFIKYISVNDINDSTMMHKLIITAVQAQTDATVLGYGIMKEECVDCRYHGGIAVRPDYWGN
jgi:Domain of unknown function (DUF4249)